MRGIAILLVLLNHMLGVLPPIARGGVHTSPVAAFATAGQTGVTLFFVLSAFCLTRPLFSAGARFSVLTFFRRRALRILPMYWATVFIATLWHARSLADLSTGLPYLIFANAVPEVVTPLPAFSAVWWSLATEVQFYLSLPLFALALQSKRRRSILAVAAATYFVSYALYLCSFWGKEDVRLQLAIGHSFYGMATAFLAGATLAWIVERHGEATRLRLERSRASILTADFVLLMTIACLGLLLQWQTAVGYWQAEARPTRAWHVLEAFGWSFFTLQMLLSPLRCRALFVNRILDRIGIYSYSMYLVHLPIVVYGTSAMRQAFPGRLSEIGPHTVVTMVALTSVTVAVSAITYRYIEQPFLRLKYRADNAVAPTTHPARPFFVRMRRQRPVDVMSDGLIAR